MRHLDEKKWHFQSLNSVFDELESSPSGLLTREAVRRIDSFGANRLPEPRAIGFFELFLRQFRSPLIYVLLAAALVSMAVGEFQDAGFIFFVLFLNAAIGAYQEFQAEKNSRGLKQLLHFRTTVQRDNRIQDIESHQLVPGDIVLLESGNRVPADLRLTESQNLRIDESLLTGESIAVSKSADMIGEPDQALADRQNMAYAGSLVSHGRGRGVIVATGQNTAVGQFAISLESEDGKPPLIIRMERFTNWIAIVTVALSLIIGILQVFVAGHSVVEAFFFVTALAVSAIPEGLPVAITVCLAVAASRMSTRNVIVRRLAAVEGLGSCTLIATDKTGTLTCNELTVSELVLPDGTTIEVSGVGFVPNGRLLLEKEPIEFEHSVALSSLIQSVALCNEASLTLGTNHHWSWRGDTVDVALLTLAQKAKFDFDNHSHTKTGDIPYESENQFAAAFYQSQTNQPDCWMTYVKGSPERVLAFCSVDSQQRTFWQSKIEKLAHRGLRVLAVAQGEMSKQFCTRWSDSGHQLPLEAEKLNFCGLVAMADPIRPGVVEAVQQCRNAGVKIVMITGDHKITALSIARELKLADDESQVCTGKELEQVDDSQWPALLARTRVFARVTPAQKLAIVTAAKQSGDFVAVTGDGVNDAPALNAANIGVAMGKSGTDVARDAAELVLADDNFASIVNGIDEGRVAYDNIRKIIFLLVAMGAAELLLVFLAIMTGLPLPLLPIQLLWLNLVTDGIQGVALAFEPGEGDSLHHPPRKPDEPIFNRLMIERMSIAVLVAGLGGFAVFYGALKSGYSVEHSRNLLLLVMVLFENFHVGNCRSEYKSLLVLSPLRSPILLYGSLVAFALHVTSMYIPFMRDLLSTSPLGPRDWFIAVLVAVSVLPAIEIHKLWWNHRHRYQLSSLHTEV